MSGLNLGSPCPLVGIVMGSQSDYETLSAAEDVLLQAKIPYEISIVSAHRSPEQMYEYAISARARGLKILIAGAGGAAHLPGMVAALSTLPVLGVPVQSSALNGIDSLLSIVQMPAGIPTATFAIGKAGATNAALFAIQILGLEKIDSAEFIDKYREERRLEVEQSQHDIQKRMLQRADSEWKRLGEMT